MNVVSWNPWREVDDIFTRIAGVPSEHLSRSEWLPPVDISESEADYRIDVEIPSIAAEDVDVSLKDSVLTVSGERTSVEHENGKRHRAERQFGRFTRSFRLPEDVDADSIQASAKDGVLYLTVAKKAKAVPRRITIDVH